VVPELGYPLPCQIQGRFSSQYQPSAEKTGLEQRKDEAYALLDEYNRSMKAIGKRQPKYTEYPRMDLHMSSFSTAGADFCRCIQGATQSG
jgi:hypothetical protein